MFMISTGLRNGILVTNSFKSLLTGLTGQIEIYSGAVPATADDAIGSAVCLCKISPDGVMPSTGLTFEALAISGVLQKTSTQLWKGTNIASGTASFYRFKSAADINDLSTTAIRVQGSVGMVNADLLLASTTLTISQEQRIDYYAVGMPSS